MQLIISKAINEKDLSSKEDHLWMNTNVYCVHKKHIK